MNIDEQTRPTPNPTELLVNRSPTKNDNALITTTDALNDIINAKSLDNQSLNGERLDSESLDDISLDSESLSPELV